MGCSVESKCLDCGKTFMVDDGGGFFSHLVRCDKCGETKSIDIFYGSDESALSGLDESNELDLSGLGELTLGEIEKILGINDSQHASVKPVSEEEYNSGIEAMAGECSCGGKYTLDAPPRCPNCRSTRIKEIGDMIMYD